MKEQVRFGGALITVVRIFRVFIKQLFILWQERFRCRDMGATKADIFLSRRVSLLPAAVTKYPRPGSTPTGKTRFRLGSQR